MSTNLNKISFLVVSFALFDPSHFYDRKLLPSLGIEPDVAPLKLIPDNE